MQIEYTPDELIEFLEWEIKCLKQEIDQLNLDSSDRTRLERRAEREQKERTGGR